MVVFKTGTKAAWTDCDFQKSIAENARIIARFHQLKRESEELIARASHLRADLQELSLNRRTVFQYRISRLSGENPLNAEDCLIQDANRYRLLGQYVTPQFDCGQVVFCERLGEVEIVGLTDARISWPVGQRRGTRRQFIILFAGLAEAVRRESNQAICHWWGVTPQIVSKWRKALGVPHATEGTSRLHKDCKQQAAIAEAKSSTAQPPHVLDLRTANMDENHSPEEREQMSTGHKKQDTIPTKAKRLWTAEEDEAVRTLPLEDAARKTGRTIMAIYNRRRRLGLPDARTRKQRKAHGKVAWE